MARVETLLEAILEALQTTSAMRESAADECDKSGKSFAIPSQKVTKQVAAPSKIELALEWLRQYPEDRKKSGRALERDARPMGIEISRTYWNQAKQRKG